MNAAFFSAYADIEAHLDLLGMFHMDLRLERMRRVLAALKPGNAGARVQVVGTNGKGSTSVFLASLAAASGLSAGLFTSPHLASVRERIRLFCPQRGSFLLPESAWPDPANAVMAAGGGSLTYFEFLTVLAVKVFADAGCDLAVFEAGLGGTHDATTSLEKDVLCITPIGLDHEAVLGNTPEAVARDKAGAMRPGVPAFSAPQSSGVEAVLRECAQRAGASLNMASPARKNLRLGLSGPHQRLNAGLAVAAWRHLAETRGWKSDARVIGRGLSTAWLPGRLQLIPAGPGHPSLILDGAHNAHGLAALERALPDLPQQPQSLVFCCMADKDLDSMLPLVRRIAARKPVFVPPVANCIRAMNPADLAQSIGPNAIAAPSLAAALTAAMPHGPALMLGSLYMLGEFFILWPEYLDMDSAGLKQS